MDDYVAVHQFDSCTKQRGLGRAAKAPVSRWAAISVGGIAGGTPDPGLGLSIQFGRFSIFSTKSRLLRSPIMTTLGSGESRISVGEIVT
jgi:hypothetical protein